MSEYAQKLASIVALIVILGIGKTILGKSLLLDSETKNVHTKLNAENLPPLFKLSAPPPLFASLGTLGGIFSESTSASPSVATTSPTTHPTLEAASPATPPPAKKKILPVDAEAVLAANLGSAPFFTLNAEKRWPMASLTKLMTAAISFEVLDLGKPITLIDNDFKVPSVQAYFKPGETYTALDLLKGMLLFSSNEAAEALARSYGNDQFINKMNVQAKEWGLSNTYFDESAGLSSADQSTINDLQLFVRRLYIEYPQIFEITKMPRATVRELSSGEIKTIENINQFAGTSNFLGGKTGHTDEAKGNLISLFSYKGNLLLIIVLGTDDRFGDTTRLFDLVKKTNS
jgi:D-alanyl-D-alanine carboxypeptidase (penicillin-binding protein 5/6)